MGPVPSRPWLSAPRELRSWLGIDPFALGCGAFDFAATLSLTAFAYQWHPHVPDEVAYLWHANYFAAGSLRTPLPPVPEAFAGYLIDCDARGFVSPVPPGWPAMLALGVLAGAPWLVNPALSAAIVLLVFALARAVYDARVARAATLLIAASPWFLLTGMSLMTHQASLFWALVAALASVRVWRGGSLAWCVVTDAYPAGVRGPSRPRWASTWPTA